MEEQMAKPVSASRTEQIQIVMPQHINGSGRLFGGQLVAWIDIVASVVAKRHSGMEVTTASVDDLQFKKPAYVNDTVVLIGRVTHVGTSSMEVRVDSFAERHGQVQELVNRAYFTLVALDEHDHPARVPRLLLETDEERAEWNAWERRSAMRREHCKGD